MWLTTSNYLKIPSKFSWLLAGVVHVLAIGMWEVKHFWFYLLLFSTVNESFTKLRLTCFHAVDFCWGVIISLIAIETGRIFQSKVSCFLLRFAVSFSQVWRLHCLCLSSFLYHLLIICFVPWNFHTLMQAKLCASLLIVLFCFVLLCPSSVLCQHLGCKRAQCNWNLYNPHVNVNNPSLQKQKTSSS